MLPEDLIDELSILSCPVLSCRQEESLSEEEQREDTELSNLTEAGRDEDITHKHHCFIVFSIFKHSKVIVARKGSHNLSR